MTTQPKAPKPFLYSFSYFVGTPVPMPAIARRLLGSPCGRPFPACLLLLAKLVAQPPGIVWGDYGDNRKYNAANRESQRRLSACSTAFHEAVALGILDEDLVSASEGRAVSLHAHQGGDYTLTFTLRRGAEYRYSTTQLVNAAINVAKARYKQQVKQQRAQGLVASPEYLAELAAKMTKKSIDNA